MSTLRPVRISPAFTLIELLVVVAIISLLISILMPALSRARAQSQQLLCKTQLRSLGQATALYAQNNDGIIIRGQKEAGGTGLIKDGYHFSSIMLRDLGFDEPIKWQYGGVNNVGQKPYIEFIGKVKQFQCPTFPQEAVKTLANNPFKQQHLTYVVSAFAIPYPEQAVLANANGGGQGGTTYAGASVPEATVAASKLSQFPREAHPSSMVHITEGHVSLPTNTLYYHDLFLASHLPFGANPRIANDPRHPGGVNALFFDSHVETLRLGTLDPGWPQPLRERLRSFTVLPPGLGE